MILTFYSGVTSPTGENDTPSLALHLLLVILKFIIIFVFKFFRITQILYHFNHVILGSIYLFIPLLMYTYSVKFHFPNCQNLLNSLSFKTF